MRGVFHSQLRDEHLERGCGHGGKERFGYGGFAGMYIGRLKLLYMVF